jgi:hypothetical protein
LLIKYHFYDDTANKPIFLEPFLELGTGHIDLIWADGSSLLSLRLFIHKQHILLLNNVIDLFEPIIFNHVTMINWCLNGLRVICNLLILPVNIWKSLSLKLSFSVFGIILVIFEVTIFILGSYILCDIIIWNRLWLIFANCGCFGWNTGRVCVMSFKGLGIVRYPLSLGESFKILKKILVCYGSVIVTCIHQISHHLIWIFF